MRAFEDTAKRHLLIARMQELDQKGINCSKCQGHCCTMLKNSMQIDDDEAQTIKNYLLSQGSWSEELKERLQECIREFRLNQSVSTGKGTWLRRNYTCPFYTQGFKGCQLPRDIRPLGCLAFNPTSKNETQGQSCLTPGELLSESSPSPKSPLPLALLELF